MYHQTIDMLAINDETRLDKTIPDKEVYIHG